MAEDLTRWEYKKITLDDVKDVTTLNKLGDEGWELVNVPESGMGMGMKGHGMMKRPKQKKSPSFGYDDYGRGY